MDHILLAAYRRRALAVMAAWLAILLIGALPALRLGTVVRGGSDAVPGSESIEAVERAVAAGVPAGGFYPFVAVLHADDEVVGHAAFARLAQRLSTALLERGGATRVQSLWNTGDVRLVGRSRHSALLLIDTGASSFSEAELATAPLRAAVDSVRLPRGFSCEITGQPAVLYDLNRRSSTDLLAAERVGLPLTLLVLLLVFRSPIAALLPVALAMTAATLSLAALYVLSRFTIVSVFAQNAVTMIGLGVGVDYALLLVAAFRPALAAGQTPERAARRALEEVRSTIICSGAAVAIGFLALSLVRLPFLKALVVGGVVVVGVAVMATLTLLPALLAVLGRRVDWPCQPSAASAGGTFWRRWAQLVMRRPILCSGVSLILLGCLAAPVLRMSPWNLGASGLAPDLEARRGYTLLERDFEPGWMGPTALIIEAPAGRTVLEEDARAGIRRLVAYLGQDPGITAVEASAPASRVAILALITADPPESTAAAARVKRLRSEAGAALAGTGLSLAVSGAPAMLADFDQEIFTKMRIVVPLVLLLTFVVLLLHLRSLLIPLKAIALNLLSVLASYGFLILVFQDGHGAGLLRLQPPGGLNAFIVLMLFTILFGLSMDYEVFLLSAMRARYLRNGDPEQAVLQGIAQTGGTVTSAAAIMISLFLAFGFTELVATRELGLGLAFAVALDASIVRLVLLPALMALFGRANWWLPCVGSRPRGALA